MACSQGHAGIDELLCTLTKKQIVKNRVERWAQESAAVQEGAVVVQEERAAV